MDGAVRAGRCGARAVRARGAGRRGAGAVRVRAAAPRRPAAGAVRAPGGAEADGEAGAAAARPDSGPRRRPNRRGAAAAAQKAEGRAPLRARPRAESAASAASAESAEQRAHGGARSANAESGLRAAAPSAKAPAPLADAAAALDPVAAEVERRGAAGELAEARRRPGACVDERLAWIDARRNRIRKVLERRGELQLERWYDADGRLRAVRVGRPGAAPFLAAVGEDGGVVREEGEADAASRALALDARDADAAFFGPPRCEPQAKP